MKIHLKTKRNSRYFGEVVPESKPCEREQWVKKAVIEYKLNIISNDIKQRFKIQN